MAATAPDHAPYGPKTVSRLTQAWEKAGTIATVDSIMPHHHRNTPLYNFVLVSHGEVLGSKDNPEKAGTFVRILGRIVQDDKLVFEVLAVEENFGDVIGSASFHVNADDLKPHMLVYEQVIVSVFLGIAVTNDTNHFSVSMHLTRDELDAECCTVHELVLLKPPAATDRHLAFTLVLDLTVMTRDATRLLCNTYKDMLTVGFHVSASSIAKMHTDYSNIVKVTAVVGHKESAAKGD